MRLNSITVSLVMGFLTIAQLHANSPPVVSQVALRDQADTKQISISYDLQDAEGDACTVWVAVSDNGATRWTVPALTFSGDVGENIAVGLNKSVVWDASADVPSWQGMKYAVHIYADDNRGPAPMVLVSAGPFPYQNVSNRTEWVDVDSFLIDKFEVTNEFYCRFLNDTDRDGRYWSDYMHILPQGEKGQFRYEVVAGKESHPVRHIHYHDAHAFARWRGQKDGVTYRLPNEHQWEKAAGWDPVNEKFYPYGFHHDLIDEKWCNFGEHRKAEIAVGHYNGSNGRGNARCYYGCYDMSGNLWTWTEGLIGGKYSVLRGGAWNEPAKSCRITHRLTHRIVRGHTIGFRLIRELP